VKWIIFSDALVSFDVLLEHSKSEYWTGLTRISRPGAISPVLNWSMAAVG
jgi:hypothetical protein